MHRSLFALLTALALLTAACADTGADGPSPSDPPTTTSTTAAGGDETPSSTAPSGDDPGTTDATTPPPDGEPARDFSLALGADQTEQFVLSQEVKPVFMVFWAEW